jgi:signal peptidase II
MKNEGRVGVGRWLLFWSIALGGTAFDLTTKSIIFSRLGHPHAQTYPLIPNLLELHTSENTGALWGIGAGLPRSSLIFAGLSVVAAFVIFYYLFFLGAASSRVLTVALGLIMAGAMGNCYDRLALGYVRDFVHFHIDAINFECAIFNFADNMLVIGACTLLLYALRPEKQPAEQESKPFVDVDRAPAPASDVERVDDQVSPESRHRHAAGSLPSPAPSTPACS